MEERSWYGYQLIISDVISAGIVASAFYECPIFFLLPTVGVCSAAADRALAGFGTLTVVPAIIHLAHGRFVAAGGSLVLRAVLPLALGLAFPPAGAVALLVGVFIDDAFLSYQPRPSVEEEAGVLPAAWPLSRNH